MKYCFDDEHPLSMHFSCHDLQMSFEFTLVSFRISLVLKLSALNRGTEAYNQTRNGEQPRLQRETESKVSAQ